MNQKYTNNSNIIQNTIIFLTAFLLNVALLISVLPIIYNPQLSSVQLHKNPSPTSAIIFTYQHLTLVTMFKIIAHRKSEKGTLM